MLRVIGVAADFPEVRLECLAAVGEILLCLEGFLVGGVGAQVLRACSYGCGDSFETCACQLLVCRDRCRTLRFLTDIDAVTVLALGGRYAVRA